MSLIWFRDLVSSISLELKSFVVAMVEMHCAVTRGPGPTGDSFVHRTTRRVKQKAITRGVRAPACPHRGRAYGQETLLSAARLRQRRERLTHRPTEAIASISFSLTV